MAGDKNYLDLLEKMKDLHIKKNAGYSGDGQDRWANFRMSESFGVSAVLGCLVRMSDKFIRIQNLIKNPKNEQVGEAITDTLMDLASYALITICLLNETKPEDTFYIQISHSRLDDDLCWYNNHDNEVFVVKNSKDFEHCYSVVSGKYIGNLIYKIDCRVCEVEVET